MPNPKTIRVRRKGGRPDIYTLNEADFNPQIWEIVTGPPVEVSSPPAGAEVAEAGESEAPKRGKRQK